MGSAVLAGLSGPVGRRRDGLVRPALSYLWGDFHLARAGRDVLLRALLLRQARQRPALRGVFHTQDRFGDVSWLSRFFRRAETSSSCSGFSMPSIPRARQPGGRWGGRGMIIFARCGAISGASSAPRTFWRI